MSVLATDDFNRADGALGANWGTVPGMDAFQVASNAAKNTAPSASITAGRYTGTAAPADQYSKCTLAGIEATSDEGPGPAARMASGANTMYFAQCNTTETKLYRAITGSFTQLGSDGPPAAANDVIEIDVSGTSITVKQNGSTIIGPITNSSIASGDWGLWNGGGASNAHGVDNWEGGDFASSGLTAAQQAGIFAQQLSGGLIGRVDA